MSCQETQQSLSLYLDDELAQPLREACDEHLRECPLCRAELARMRGVSRALGALTRPVPPADLASSISDALEIEAAARARQPVLPLSVKLVRWLRPRLMPYTVGSFASVLLFSVMFNALRPHMQALAEASLAAREDMASYKIIYIGTDGPDISQPITPELFAAQRAPVGVESPSLNPRGALAALTREKTHGHDEGEDDMIVVADVFSNGRASLADVVHPPRDRRMLDEFKDALRKNAAFVPAYYDQRPETMRVVFVVQKVDVPEQNF